MLFAGHGIGPGPQQACFWLAGAGRGTNMQPDDLSSLKEDMIAFVEGHGLKRFRGYVGEEVNSVTWDSGDDPDGWKDFVELAKSSGAPFVTMNHFVLQRSDLDYLLEGLRHVPWGDDEELEEARWLRTYLGRTGFVQLGWPYQGVLFLYEASSGWYERYQHLLDLVDERSITIDEPDQDDER